MFVLCLTLLHDPLLLLLNRPVKYPALMDSMRLVFPLAEWPNTFTLILGMGALVGINWSM